MITYFVTEIKKLTKGKYEVSLEGGEPLVLYGREINAYGIKEQSTITESVYRRIMEEVLNKRATKRAMHLMERQDRTEANLREKLCENHYPTESIDVAVDYLKRFHYLDDRRFAENYISFHQEKESRRIIRQKLLQKGVPSGIAEEALEEFYEADEEALILELLRKRGYGSDADSKEKQKMYAFLMRKGFSASAIAHVMRLSDYDS